MDTNRNLDRHELASGHAWDEFCERIKRTGRLVLEAAPDDDFDRAEGLRYVGRIVRHGLDSFVERSDPAAPAISSSLPKMGGDNPDYVYGSAPVSGRYEYRLQGNLGEARYVGIGTYTGDVGTKEGLKLSGYLSTAQLGADDDGRFAVVLACKEPSDAAGSAWLPMSPDTTQLMTRQTLLDRRSQRLASFEIERRDGAGGVSPLQPERYAEQLERAGAYVEGAIAQFLGWTRNFASTPNQIRPLDPELEANAQGDPSTHYFGGYYEIGDGEQLVVEFVPPACEYWNLQLCNHWLESLDYEHHRVHLNDHSAVAGPDGRVRVVVAAADPGSPNWLDTAGHRRGCMVFRQIGTDQPVTPECRVEAAGTGAHS